LSPHATIVSLEDVLGLDKILVVHLVMNSFFVLDNVDILLQFWRYVIWLDGLWPPESVHTPPINKENEAKEDE
jgi:hypothetical protein